MIDSFLNKIFAVIFLIFVPLMGMGQFEKNAEMDSILNLIKDSRENRTDVLARELAKFEIRGDIKSQLILLGTKMRIMPTDSSPRIIRRIKDLANLPGQEQFLPQARFFEGVYYFRKRDYNRSIDILIDAVKWCEKYPNDFVLSRSLHALALMKQRFTDYDGAKESMQKVEELYVRNNDSLGLTNIRFALFSLYLEMGKIDSARYHHDRSKILSSPPIRTKNQSLLAEGLCLYHEGRFNRSIDTLSMVKGFFAKNRDYANLSFCYYYLGRDYESLNQEKTKISYLKRIDSIYEFSDYLPKMVRPAFTELIRYHNEKDQNELSLHYARTLVKFDSMQSSLGLGLQKQVMVDYEIDKLKRTQKDVISKKDEKINNIVPLLWIFGGLSFLALILSFIYYRREKTKDKMFLQLKEKLAKSNNFPVKAKRSDGKVSSISMKSQENLDAFFKQVQNENLFLRQDFGVKYINQSTKVNEHDIASYVKSILNKPNLTVHINDLRIGKAAKLFMSDSRFSSKITLKAMANELGYGSPKTFNKAFLERHGIKPMEFLARLKKENNR